MDFGDYYWILWLFLFLLVEIPAAIWKPEWTLSHHVWDWFAIGKNWKDNYAGLRWFILAGLAISTTLHFLAFFPSSLIIIFGIGAAWSIYYHYRYEHNGN